MNANERARQIAEYQKQIADLQNQYKQMQDNYARTQGDYKRVQGEYSGLQKQLGELQGNYGTLSGQNEKLQNTYNDLNSRYTATEKQLGDTQNKLVGAEKNANTANANLDRLTRVMGDRGRFEEDEMMSVGGNTGLQDGAGIDLSVVDFTKSIRRGARKDGLKKIMSGGK